LGCSPEVEIYLMRHGETEWNASGRFQGKLDSALTVNGIAQAEACGRRLAGISPVVSAFFASPLGRVRHTASIVSSFGTYPQTLWDDRLAEVSIGSWDGLTQIDIDAQWPSALDGATPFDWFFRSPDGESYESACARVHQWLGGLQGVTVVISHGLIGRIIRGVYLGLSRDDALGLPVPQDVIWYLADGRIEPIAT
jgi:probable phosphoglycerate mutase